MIILTITCHNVYNHGALLQAYALQQYIKNLGHETGIIDYRPYYLSQHFKFSRIDNKKYDRIIIKQLYIIAKFPSRLLSLRRKKAFDKFSKKYLSITPKIYKNIYELVKHPPVADIYIAGSDQIWNTFFCNGCDPAFYLNFGNAFKISYAASFATSKLKKGTEHFVANQLRNINKISVREFSGLKILDKLGYKGLKVVDPVFLLTPSEWNRITTDKIKQKYILIYDFECNHEIRNISKRIATLTKSKIFSIGPYKLDYSDKNFINYGPDYFLSLVKNATCIISNSFHGTAFSIIFKRDFFVIKRSDGLNQRMEDFLASYNLSDRFVDTTATDEQLLSHIDYNNITHQLTHDINESERFIISCISDAKHCT